MIVYVLTYEISGDRYVFGFTTPEARKAHAWAVIDDLVTEGGLSGADVPRGDLDEAWDYVRADDVDGMWLDKVTLDKPTLRESALFDAAPVMRDAIAKALPWIEMTGIADDEPEEWAGLVAALTLAGGPPDAPDAARGDRDDSAVIHADAVDDASEWPLPWRFETDDGASYFATEDEACAMQRDHRKRNGFDPMTGERSAPQTPDASALMLAALREAQGVISDLSHQCGQMRGMFSDDDGEIARAIEEGEEAYTTIAAAIRAAEGREG